MSMKARDLKTDELSYEIAIRGVAVPSSFDLKRSVLNGLLAQEDGSRSFLVFSNPFRFSEEVEQVEKSLTDVSEKVEEFTGSVGTAEHRRITSRLTHLSGRISRMNPVGDDQLAIRNQLQQRLLILESDFKDKLSPDEVPPAVDKQPTSGPALIVPAISAPGHIVPQVREHPESAPPVTSTPNVSVNLFGKKVPVYKWGIQRFSGQGSLISFLELIESLRTSRGCTKEDLFASAGDLFESHAWTWWHNAQINSKFSSWDELVVGLKQTFLRENYDRSLWDEIRARKQGCKEPVLLFISSMEALFYRLTNVPSEQEMVDTIKINLLPDYIKLLALHDISSIDQLTSLCKKIDDSLQLCKNTIPSTSSHSYSSGFSRTPRVNVISSHITCWNCQRTGHHYNSCFAKRSLFCHSCGKPGVVSQHCSCRSKNEHSTGKSRMDAIASTSPKPSTSKVFHRNTKSGN